MPTEIDTMLVVAADSEAKAVAKAFGQTDDSTSEFQVLRPGLWLLKTGVGKANAAAGVASTIARNRVARVVNIGIGGALPDSGLEIGDRVLASSSIFADEGIDTPDGFLDCRSMGLSLYPEDRGTGLPPDSALAHLLEGVIGRRSVVATVSTCSGRDDLAQRIRRRTGGGVECMEGAAVMLACHRLGVPAAEVRVISNTTGDRVDQVWDIGRALGILGATACEISDVLSG